MTELSDAGTVGDSSSLIPPFDPTVVNLAKMADALATLPIHQLTDADGDLSSPCASVTIGAAQADEVVEVLHALARKFEQAERVPGDRQPACRLMLGDNQLVAVVAALRGSGERMRSHLHYATGAPDAEVAA